MEILHRIIFFVSLACSCGYMIRGSDSKATYFLLVAIWFSILYYGDDDEDDDDDGAKG